MVAPLKEGISYRTGIFCLPINLTRVAIYKRWEAHRMSKEGMQSKRPNILLILNDDMGYSDIGCYGGEIDTPHLDRLAANGLRYSQFYNTARCSPSRASLLTGLHPHQTGI